VQLLDLVRSGFYGRPVSEAWRDGVLWVITLGGPRRQVGRFPAGMLAMVVLREGRGA